MITIQPAAGRHAIKSVTLAIEWPAPLDATAIIEISNLHDQFKNDLPRKVDQQSVTINIAGGNFPAMIQQPIAPQISGVVFDRVKENRQAAWALSLQQNMAVVVCNAYDRWQEMKARSLGFLGVILPTVLRYQPIAVVGLQYLDQFDVTGDIEELTYAHIFRDGSRYVPGNARDLIGLWHSHHGFFQTFENPVQYRRLTNINVNVSAQGNSRVAQIVTAHKALLDQPTNDPNLLLEQPNNMVGQLLEEMHDFNKTILRDLLNDARREQIALN